MKYSIRSYMTTWIFLFLPSFIVVYPQKTLSQKPMYRASISQLSHSGILGTADFYKENNGVIIRVDLKNLPDGTYGFHIHEKGDCNSEDGMSAGGHWNPTNKKHGKPGQSSHVGDMGNLTLRHGKGEVTIDWNETELASIEKRSVIIHEGKDDLTSQPAGNSGKRIGCGVVQKI